MGCLVASWHMICGYSINTTSNGQQADGLTLTQTDRRLRMRVQRRSTGPLDRLCDVMPCASIDPVANFGSGQCPSEGWVLAARKGASDAVGQA